MMTPGQIIPFFRTSRVHNAGRCSLHLLPELAFSSCKLFGNRATSPLHLIPQFVPNPPFQAHFPLSSSHSPEPAPGNLRYKHSCTFLPSSFRSFRLGALLTLGSICCNSTCLLIPSLVLTSSDFPDFLG